MAKKSALQREFIESVQKLERLNKQMQTFPVAVAGRR